MRIRIVSYGIAKDIIGNSKFDLETTEGISVEKLLIDLKERFPELKRLSSLLVAVNDEYAENGYLIKESDELVLIPPVSGG